MNRPRILAVPMHGEIKIRREGLRTRDGHLLEWLGHIRPDLELVVQSRPEPWPRVTIARRAELEIPASWHLMSPEPIAFPSPRGRRRWWVDSLRYESPVVETSAAIIWNPIAGAAKLSSLRGTRVLVDLLDDWSRHTAFEPIARDVISAYERLFATAEIITANSEGTVALAERFGRSDVKLIRNGADPGRFSRSVRQHSVFTVGYGGKIGHRLDVELIEDVAGRFPHWFFEFVGPVLVRSVGRRLKRIKNVSLAGDVRYDAYPKRFEKWDVAWVPHRLGPAEVGGDVIKIYEYRAAGLPVATTRIIGWERALDGVRIADGPDLASVLRDLAGDSVPGGVERDHYVTPTVDTWEHKAREILALLEV